jgi:hypothetical protein
LQLGLLKLHADPLLERVEVAKRIEAEHGNLAPIRHAQTLDALQRRRLAGAVRSDEPEDLAVADVERDFVHGNGTAVGLAATRDANDYVFAAVHVPSAISLINLLGELAMSWRKRRC